MLNIARVFCRRGVLLKIYSHKMKNFKSVLLLYFHLVTKTTFHIVWKTEAVFSVVFIAQYLMHHSVILWNRPSMHSENE